MVAGTSDILAKYWHKNLIYLRLTLIEQSYILERAQRLDRLYLHVGILLAC